MWVARWPPCAGVALALAGRSRRAWRVGGTFLAGLAPIGAYASFIEPSRLVLERTDVSSLLRLR